MWTKAPKRPEDVFDAFVQDLKALFGRELLAIYLYGSGARGDYVPGKSDINFLVCLTPEGIICLDRVWTRVSKWRRKRIAQPLFITHEFMRASVDVFPVEYLNMKLHHRCIFGENILDGLEIRQEHLRLQLEREFRGKLLHLWQGFVHSEGKAHLLREIIRASVTAFASLFVAVLYIYGEDIPASRKELFARVEGRLNFKTGILDRCWDVRQGRERLRSSEVIDLYREYMAVIDRLCINIDRMS